MQPSDNAQQRKVNPFDYKVPPTTPPANSKYVSVSDFVPNRWWVPIERGYVSIEPRRGGRIGTL